MNFNRGLCGELMTRKPRPFV
uniref:Uncharacterized protein n=1 Tax=Rhizophora mucronata TaxID=61149 RepID=A0A2P2N9I7_RHIMU